MLAPISFPSPSELNGHERPTSLHHPLNPYRTPTPPRSSQVFSTLDVSSLSNSRNPSDVLKLRFEAQKPTESGRHESTSDLFNRIRPGYVLKRDIRTPEAMKDYRVSGSLVAQPGRVLYKYRPSSLEELLRPANPRLLDQDRVCRHLYSFLSLQEINLVQSVIPHSERVLTSKSEPFKDPYCLQRLFDVEFLMTRARTWQTPDFSCTG